MDSTADERSLDDVLGGHRFAMVTTSTPRGLAARPLTLLEQEDATLRFLVSTDSEWVRELGDPVASIQVSFASPDDSSYVALQGHATVDRDPEAVARIWNPAAAAFLDGPDDPAAAVLEAQIDDGQWWQGPGTKVGMAIALARRALTGREAGQHGRVEPER